LLKQICFKKQAEKAAAEAELSKKEALLTSANSAKDSLLSASDTLQVLPPTAVTHLHLPLQHFLHSKMLQPPQIMQQLRKLPLLPLCRTRGGGASGCH
jgi:hypothetical protein